MREAPSRVVIDDLLARGATVRAYDPVGGTRRSRIFADEPRRRDRRRRRSAALEGADALAIVTEWQEFRSPDFAAIKAQLKTPAIFDGRNLYDPAVVQRARHRVFPDRQRSTVKSTRHLRRRACWWSAT